MAASSVPVAIVRRRFGETARRDLWWIQPILVFMGLSTFLVYATWAAFQGDHYTYGPYLSPFYWGENSFPLVLQNIHRYMLYLSMAVLLILAIDAFEAYWFVEPGTGKASFGIGVGTLILTGNVVLLAGYLFGCHSLRHVAGGCV